MFMIAVVAKDKAMDIIILKSVGENPERSVFLRRTS
jgi:hypothetical protein